MISKYNNIYNIIINIKLKEKSEILLIDYYVSNPWSRYTDRINV